MNTGRIKVFAAAVEEQRKVLNSLIEQRNLLDLGGHQEDVVICIGNNRETKIRVTNLSRETGWASKLIRGRDMILLGAKLAINAKIDEQAERVAEAERELKVEIEK